MARKPTGKPTGRPPKQLDQKTFENLCFIWCTVEEMENILEANRDTISAWCQRTYGENFSSVYKRFSDGGKASLRRNQLHLSKTNAAMAIWLGKQWLNQKDNNDVHVSQLNLHELRKALKEGEITQPDTID